MDAIRLPFEFDVVAMRADLARFGPEDFYNICNPYVDADQLFGLHLIEPEPGASGAPEFLPNERLKQCDYLPQVLEAFHCRKETFRIHVLKAGATIRQHRDIGRNVQNGIFRLHIPIHTDAGVETYLNGEPVVMEPGSCWYLNFDLPHHILNRSTQDRIHLIMDCQWNAWWAEVFQQHGHPLPDLEAPAALPPEQLTAMIRELEQQDTPASRALIRQLTSGE